MATNFSRKRMLPMEAELGYYRAYSAAFPNKNPSNNGPDGTFPNNLGQIVFSVLIFLICIFGLLGNGTIIWFLGFCIARNPFTTYILNLAAADFEILICLVTFLAVGCFNEGTFVPSVLFPIALEIFLLIYSVSQLLVMAVSIEGCTSAFYPVWHQCHRPPQWSTVVCAVIWVFSFLLDAIVLVLHTEFYPQMYYQFIVSVLLCTPGMIISTLSLFTKVCLKSRQQQQWKVLTAIFLILLFSLFFDLPLNAFYITYFPVAHAYRMELRLFCASLNSSIKPVIYFQVGKQKVDLSRESIKVILQRVFTEDEGCKEELELPVQAQL
ncbi:mas-related G-protein coupled receptor member H-like [Rhineura floridana]|uniref:mas-related G-protein coupled receptor member H-like n=1 Tax=Rhineura floridana TaxID=261503 RepID=UPI002AC84038|nr:mas-related G-protein coupled receptor member H-like [Rhineura floridana]